MKRFITIALLLASITISANDIVLRYSTEPLKVDIPEWDFDLSVAKMSSPKMKLGDMSAVASVNNVKATHEVFKWMKTNPGVKPYKFMDDMTFAGIPLFVGGIILKSEKNTFRQNTQDPLHANTRLLTHFKSSIDDYSQYFGPVMTVGLKAFAILLNILPKKCVQTAVQPTPGLQDIQPTHLLELPYYIRNMV